VAGRGKVIADTSVAQLIAAASGGRVTLRTNAGPAAMKVLTRIGATVAVTGSDTLSVTGLAADQVVAQLSQAGVGFSEISAHRATLQEAYMELTRDAVEYRAAAVTEAVR
jgi:ABC-2 type transport system ATP-binding protein